MADTDNDSSYKSGKAVGEGATSALEKYWPLLFGPMGTDYVASQSEPYQNALKAGTSFGQGLAAGIGGEEDQEPTQTDKVPPTAPDEVPKSQSLFNAVGDKYRSLQESGQISPGDASGVSPSAGVPTASVAPGAGAAQSSGAGTSTSLQDMMKEVYGQGLGDNDIKAAQQMAAQSRLIGQLGSAGSIIGAGVAKNAIAPNTEISNQVIANANIPVENILQRRAAISQNIQSALQASNLMDVAQMRDPNSAASVAMRNTTGQLLQQVGMKAPPGFNNMSGEAIKIMLPQIDTASKVMGIQAQRQFMTALRQTQLENAAEQKYGTAREQLYSMRGAAGRAAQVVQAAQKLEEVANQFKDKDTIPANILEAMKADFATIMQNGGMPHEGEMRRLIPDTLMNKLSQLGTVAFNSPQGASAGPFVNQLVDVTKGLKKVSMQYAQDHEKVLLGTFKNSLRPDFYNAQNSRVNSIMDANMNSEHPPGSVVVVKGKQYIVGSDGDTLLDPQTGKPATQ